MHSTVVYLLLIGVFIGISKAEITEEEDVLVLTSDNFKEAIDKHKFIMVEFYAPWCGHCKALAPEYTQAAGTLKEENSEIKLAKIDATDAREIAQKYGVGGYPTLKYFRSGEPIVFKGPRTAEGIIKWMKEKSGPPAASLDSVEDTKKFIEGGEVVVIGFFGDQKGFQAKNYMLAAEELDDFGYKFGITSDPDVFASYGIKDEGLVLFKTFDEGRNNFEGKPYSVEEIKNFIVPNSLPVLVEFDTKYAARIYQVSTKKGALYLIISSKSDDYAAQKEIANKIAHEYKGKMLTIILDAEVETNKRFIGMLGAEGLDVPVMRFAYGWQTKYMPSSTGMTEEKIREFLNEQFSGKATQITWSKTEDIPDDWDKEAVKVLVGKNFNDVIKSKKQVFVEFYAPWCGHCKALTPVWNELGEKLKDREDIMIAKLEATANTVDSVRVSSYPTLYLFKGSVRNQIKFPGERSLDGLLTFLDEQGIKVMDKKEEKDEL